MSIATLIRRRAVALAAGLAFLGLAVAELAGGTTLSATAAAPSATAATASCLTAANALVKQAEAPLHFAVPSTPVKMTANKGKLLYDVSPTLTNTLQAAIASGAASAAKAAGMQFKSWDGMNSVPTENQGVTEAVSGGAKGIILQSVASSIISGPLASATSAKIPVVNWDDDDPNAPLRGVSARVTSNFTMDGRAMGAYVLVHSNCNAHALVLYPGQFPNNVDISNGFVDEVKSLCAACKVTAEAINPATMSTAVGPIVQASIRRDPKLEWVVPTFDFLATVIVPAIQAMGAQGKHVYVVSHDGNPPNLAYIRKHEVQVADIAFPPAQYQGWVLVDQVARLMAGQKSVADVIPTALVDTSNIPSTDAKLYAKFGNYEAAFKKVWGR